MGENRLATRGATTEVAVPATVETDGLLERDAELDRIGLALERAREGAGGCC